MPESFENNFPKIVAAKPFGQGVYLCIAYEGAKKDLYIILQGFFTTLNMTYNPPRASRYTYEKQSIDCEPKFDWVTLGIFNEDQVKKKYGFTHEDLHTPPQIPVQPLQLENLTIEK